MADGKDRVDELEQALSENGEFGVFYELRDGYIQATEPPSYNRGDKIYVLCVVADGDLYLSRVRESTLMVGGAREKVDVRKYLEGAAALNLAGKGFNADSIEDPRDVWCDEWAISKLRKLEAGDE